MSAAIALAVSIRAFRLFFFFPIGLSLLSFIVSLGTIILKKRPGISSRGIVILAFYHPLK